MGGIWKDRPVFPQESVTHFPDKIAGRTDKDKIAFLTEKMQEKGVEYLLISKPDSVCWLLNVRGKDVPFTPMVLSYALVHKNGKVDWFVGKNKASVCSFDTDITIYDKDDIIQVLSDLKHGKIWLDEKAVSVKLLNILEDQDFDIMREDDPCILEKAKKTKAEQEAMRQAHIRDGVALVKFLKWLEEHGASGQETELSIEEKLESFRKEDPAYKGASFSTIAGFAGNGAIIHYRASEATSKVIESDGLLLVDSGGQYFCDDFAGTTDVTRTIVIGQPTEEMVRHYTLVLKGHIAVSMAKFPYRTTGAQIDTLARLALWQEGLDYTHGTGHGVGCYLGVHEDAASISPKGIVPFEAGMIISNEPGYYKKDTYGIRIENLVLVREEGVSSDTGKAMLGFETLTYAPYQKELIDFDLLTREEKDWLVAYTKKVFETLEPFLDDDHKVWLKSFID
ncbi:MAG: aminopeptidase P family protein [Alphaproteobacteria bacterium]|nr:aminopeptidase P family protein [Alphaproteobacteria bacterium]